MCVTIVCFAQPINVSAKPSVSAHNAVLMEQSSGRVLYEKAAHEPRRIASITKVMTAIIAIESGKMDEMVTASHEAVYAEGSSIYLEEGEKMKLKDLVYGLMLRSGNDSAVAIAEHVGGSLEGFVYLMNEKARWLGMTNSHFENPHGLDAENHRSTAYDMALLMRYAMENETFKKITSTKSYKAETRTYAWGNKNKLLTKFYDYCTGGKTGYTKKAGRTLISTAEKEDMGLVVVTLNAPNDWQDHIGLFEWAYENYDITSIQEKGAKKYSSSLDEQIKGYLHQDILFPLTENEKRKMNESTYLLKNLDQPVFNNKIGKKTYSIAGEVVAESGIYTEPSQTNNIIQDIWSTFHEMTGVY